MPESLPRESRRVLTSLATQLLDAEIDGDWDAVSTVREILSALARGGERRP